MRYLSKKWLYLKNEDTVSKVSFNKKMIRWLRSVQMQGTEIEGERAYMKRCTELSRSVRD
ncbi:MAG TPA: hypothetical protein PLS84_05545 [Salinivirgaceae bacterium]|nr:hypothetical protein [Salinivirgaceae bacterium]